MTKPKIAQIGALVRYTVKEWKEDDAARHAAALAYYTALSIAPLLLIAIWIAGLVFGADAARGRILGEIGAVTGHDAAEGVEALVESANRPHSGLVASVLGVAVLLFGASGVFGELKQSLNSIWEVEEGQRRGVLQLIRERFLSLTMVLGVAFLLLVSLVVSAALASMSAALQGRIPGGPMVWQAVSFGVSFVLITLLFALIFKVLPDADVRWRDVWIGALTTAVLFIIGKFLLALYIEKADVAGKYGAAGSLVALLIWIYYSAQIFFFGAEFTQAYARLHGSRIGKSDDRARELDRDLRAAGRGVAPAR